MTIRKTQHDPKKFILPVAEDQRGFMPKNARHSTIESGIANECHQKKRSFKVAVPPLHISASLKIDFQCGDGDDLGWDRAHYDMVSDETRSSLLNTPKI